MENKEFFAALTDLVREKGISEEAFIETLENALASGTYGAFVKSFTYSKTSGDLIASLTFPATIIVPEKQTRKRPPEYSGGHFHVCTSFFGIETV